MYLALLSVGIGSALTFAQAAALFYILDIDRYVAFRAVLNTMNLSAPFLCLGFDNSAPVLRRMHEGFPFFWNMIVLQGALGLFLLAVALVFPADSELRPLVLGVACGTSIAAALMVANHYRTSGSVQRYFAHVNVVDKFARTLIIIGMAVLLTDVLLWSISIAVFGFLYVLYSSRRTGVEMRLDAGIFREHLVISLPYVFSVMGIVLQTRMPFYASYVSDVPLTVAKIDIWLLFSLLLLIPTLNRSKVEEARSGGQLPGYIDGMRGAWPSLRNQELLLAAGVMGLACLAAFVGRIPREDLLQIGLPLLVGMMLIASQPNYVQALCFAGRAWAGVQMSVAIVAASVVCYLPRLVFPELPIPVLFVASSVAYCLIGCAVARRLGIPLRKFWRWRDLAVMAIFVTVVMVCASLFLAP